MYAIIALTLGFGLDLLIGDPHGVIHPVVLIGKLISALEKLLRRLFPKTPKGERIAGGVLWLAVVSITAGLSWSLLKLGYWVSPWLGLALQTLMTAQILATKSLKTESMKVYTALKNGTLTCARQAVSMIVGRDVEHLDEAGVARAAVETVAENTSDGILAPLFYLAIGGPVLGFFYKAVNTMDSMLGYVEPPYRDFGYVSAKMDDVFNFLPARLSALLMLAAGTLLGMDGKNGWKIFRRDRSVCAGLMGLRLGGDARYHGQLHKKKFIGDDLRPIQAEDIPAACRLLYGTAGLSLALCLGLMLIPLFL